MRGGGCRLHPFRLADALPQVPALAVFRDGEIKYTIYSIFERYPIYEVIFFVVELLKKKLRLSFIVPFVLIIST